MGLTYGEDDDKEVEVPDSVPVGYESQITMYSLDFEEFLWAYGYNETAISVLRSYFEAGETVPESIHNKYESLFREYMVVGGMPEVIPDFAVNKDFNRVERIQRDIIAEYRDDIEVKAGNNPTPSLNSYIEDFSPSYAYKLIGGRNGTIGAKITLPHYFVMFI